MASTSNRLADALKVLQGVGIVLAESARQSALLQRVAARENIARQTVQRDWVLRTVAPAGRANAAEPDSPSSTPANNLDQHAIPTFPYIFQHRQRPPTQATHHAHQNAAPSHNSAGPVPRNQQPTLQHSNSLPATLPSMASSNALDSSAVGSGIHLQPQPASLQQQCASLAEDPAGGRLAALKTQLPAGVPRMAQGMVQGMQPLATPDAAPLAHLSQAGATPLTSAAGPTAEVTEGAVSVPSGTAAGQSLAYNSPMERPDMIELAEAAHAPSIPDKLPAQESQDLPEQQPLVQHHSSTSQQGGNSGGSSASVVEQPPLQQQPPAQRRRMREARVPASPLGRVMGFAGLGAGLMYGAVKGQIGKLFSPASETSTTSALLNEENAQRLADALCRLRGAALKLGQMLSMQDEAVLPPQLQAALERVRAGADIMPRRQLEKALVAELGQDWRDGLMDFDFEPMAAASIGQVHRGVLHDRRQVAMKIQYPGVARSIESDVDNLLRLISIADLLPKGLYIESAAAVAKKELALECDYTYEAQCQRRFKQLIEGDPELRHHFGVPDVVQELCSRGVLTTELVPGVHIDKCESLPQATRDAIGTRLLHLTLKELFDWRFMQTDPNWGNTLYDAASDKLYLIDFGASREYPQGFVDDYLRMVLACANKDAEEVVLRSVRLGFLTGDESAVMLDAHTEAGFMVGTPFATAGEYDFAAHGGLTKRVTALGSIMLKHRLTPPPEEAYSLHRKLSGAFLVCIKLKAKVAARQLLLDTYSSHCFTATA